MLIGGIALGLILGLVLGGRLSNLADVRLRYLPLLFLAVIIRFGTEAALAAGVPIVEQLRLPLFVGAYVLLLVGLWANRSLPGLGIAFVGILANAIAITANGGYMPIWVPSLEFAGFPADDVRSVFHVLLPPVLDAEFLQRAGPLGDIIPIPVEIPAGVSQAVFELFWQQNWGRYPTNDLDMLIFRPDGTLYLSGGFPPGATLNSPERVSVLHPAAGRWLVVVNGFTVWDTNRGPRSGTDRYVLRVSADGTPITVD